MSSKFLLCFTCYLFLNAGNPILAQSSLTGKLQNAQTGEPLVYAHIGLVDHNLGTITDEAGNFQLLTKGPLRPNQLIQCSAVGFQTVQISVDQIQANALVKLAPQAIELTEITVTDRQRTRFKTMGHYSRSRKMVTGWSRAISRGGLRAARIKLPNKAPDAILQSLRFHLAYNEFDSILFRLHFFYPDEDGKLPAELIPLSEDLFVHHDSSTGDVDFDLKPWQIRIDQDFFVGIEVVRTYGNCASDECLHFSVVLFKDRIYFRNTVTDQWDSHKLGSPAMEVELKY